MAAFESADRLSSRSFAAAGYWLVFGVARSFPRPCPRQGRIPTIGPAPEGPETASRVRSASPVPARAVRFRYLAASSGGPTPSPRRVSLTGRTRSLAHQDRQFGRIRRGEKQAAHHRSAQAADQESELRGRALRSSEATVCGPPPGTLEYHPLMWGSGPTASARITLTGRLREQGARSPRLTQLQLDCGKLQNKTARAARTRPSQPASCRKNSPQ